MLGNQKYSTCMSIMDAILYYKVYCIYVYTHRACKQAEQRLIALSLSFLCLCVRERKTDTKTERERECALLRNASQGKQYCLHTCMNITYRYDRKWAVLWSRQWRIPWSELVSQRQSAWMTLSDWVRNPQIRPSCDETSIFLNKYLQMPCWLRNPNVVGEDESVVYGYRHVYLYTQQGTTVEN